MDRRKVLYALAAVGGALAGASRLLAHAAFPSERTIRLEVGCGALELEVVPDGDRALRLTPEGRDRWSYQGSTARLVGESYSIVVRNRTAERLKVVVGVDGLNVYGRVLVEGRSDRDVGSIVRRWGERVLEGWQLDPTRAQRFVFSPPEWSEGWGRTDSQIGTITVQVYRERERHPIDLRDRERKEGPQPGREQGVATEEQRSGEPPIGTTSGKEVESWVRTVRFEPRTLYPESAAEVIYGRPSRRSWRPSGDGLLGLEIEEARDGVRVVSVEPGSPAAEAGLEPWDLIVRVDAEVSPSPAVLRRILRGKDPGDYVFLRLRRRSHELALKLRL